MDSKPFKTLNCILQNLLIYLRIFFFYNPKLIFSYVILKNLEFIFRPSTLDAYVFGFLAPLYKVRFPKVQLQEHLKQLSNLCRFCDDILNTYFRLSLGGKVAPLQLIFE